MWVIVDKWVAPLSQDNQKHMFTSYKTTLIQSCGKGFEESQK